MDSCLKGGHGRHNQSIAGRKSPNKACHRRLLRPNWLVVPGRGSSSISNTSWSKMALQDLPAEILILITDHFRDHAGHYYGVFNLKSFQWKDLCNGLSDQDNPAHFQSLLKRGHRMYCRSFNKQELARRDDSYVSQFSSLLRMLPAIARIVISDRDDNPLGLDIKTFMHARLDRFDRRDPLWRQKWCDWHLIRLCCRPSEWHSCIWRPSSDVSPETHLTRGPPPADLLPTAFAVIDHASIFPTQFGMDLSAPLSFKAFEMSTDELKCVRRVIRNVIDLRLRIQNPVHHDGPFVEPTVDGDITKFRPLQNLTRALFITDTIQSIGIRASLDQSRNVMRSIVNYHCRNFSRSTSDIFGSTSPRCF
ncbi:hypothetical protein AJ79_08148 [Helicocarpus griseus UAMH5409]|uniref:Uncharacterized protein n=1 Tax=Helicocarpus griseus UAMH5409 TaxID=1447875 RepID=A0A2B7WVV8_9EURO|nr:hypothetical protein AJ79_08148 [Helicocarpus griseus UAMH5409]